MRGIVVCWLVAGIIALAPAGASADSTAELLEAIKSVGPQGQGNPEARQALARLVQFDASALPAILEAFQGAGPIQANWLRGAFEAIADRAIQSGGKLPRDKLEAFILDRRHDPRARRLAYKWLLKVDAGLADRVIPQMLEDESPEFRRDAVARLIEQAEALHRGGEGEQAVSVYREALRGAVDDDQVQAIIQPLEKLGHKVDLQRHFGFVTQWHVIGPFDNRSGRGFEAVYPPERELDLEAAYDGQLGPVRWEELSTAHPYGIVDIGKEIENYKGSCMYAAADFFSQREQPVELRIGTPNAWKVWVNGELLFGREEYHRGMRLDQYRVPAVLKPGRNTILVKICQDEQTEDWAQKYQFQLRVSNSTGSAVLPQTPPK